MKKKIAISLVFSFLFLNYACQSESKNINSKAETDTVQANSVTIEDTKNEYIDAEDFDSFYQKFTSDKNFQMERLKFPMRGGEFEEMEETKWTKDNWKVIKTHIDDIDQNEFDVTVEKTETSVKHTIALPNSGFSVNYIFELEDGKWLLTEYNSYNF